MPPSPSGFGYPRLYRVAKGWRALSLVLAVFPIGFGAAGTIYFATRQDSPSPHADLVFIALCLGFIGLGVYTIASALRSRLLLDHDSITTVGVFRRRWMRKADVAGRRLRPGYNGSPPTLILTPARSDVRPLKIPRMFETDGVLDGWLSELPDLDAADAGRIARERVWSEAAIAADPTLGSTQAARLTRLKRARAIARFVGVASPILYLWCIFYPRPYVVVVASVAALPWLAILMEIVPKSLFRLSENQGDVHPNLLHLLLFPGFALAARGVMDVTPLAWVPTLLPMAAVAGALFSVAIATDHGLRVRPKAWPLLLLPALAYGLGVTLLSNALLDRGPSRLFATTVNGRHVSSGRSTTFYLRLAPWGPFAHEMDAWVSRAFYQSVADGESVCAELHPGRLAIAWYVIGACPAGFLAEESKRSSRSRAEAGDAAAQYDLATELLNGAGAAGNAVAGVQWLRRSADQGYARAQYTLGSLYQTGVAVPHDLEEAAHWYRLSENSYPMSAAALGYLYEKGLGVRADAVEARRLYESAAVRDDVTGEEDLATMYSFGRGGPADPVQAFRWYLAAAGHGSLRGMNGVGYSYLTGTGTERDPAKGFAWLLAAANAGQPNAMQTVGVMYLQGDGRPQDAVAAYKWLSLAVRTYSDDDEKLPSARVMRDQVSIALTVSQIAAIDAEVAVWKPSEPQLPN